MWVLSEFSQDQRVFRFVDCASDANLVSEDSCGPLKDSFCEMIADGRLKQLVPDTEVSGETDLVPEFTTIPVKSHVGDLLFCLMAIPSVRSVFSVVRLSQNLIIVA